MKKGVYVALCVVCLMACLAGCGKLAKRPIEKYNNICFTDKYMFFIDEEDDCAYRSDFDGANVVKLTNSECLDLYTYKNELYFYGDRDVKGHFGLFKLDVDGNWCNAVVLGGNSDNVFYNDYVYSRGFVDKYLYRTKTDNIDDDEENLPLIRTTYEPLLFAKDEWMYMYSNSLKSVSRLNLKSKELENVLEGFASEITYHDGRIYYLTRDNKMKTQLKSANMDGSDEKLVLKADISEFYTIDKVIYYIDSSHGNLYRINWDGTDKKKIDESCCKGLAFNKDRIYYSDVYESGRVYSVSLDGTDKKLVLDTTLNYTEKTDYKIKVIEHKVKNEETKNVEFSAGERMYFEDEQFEQFLQVMFDKDEIYGSDLLSVQYIGYYEGAPKNISVLRNHGTYSCLYENGVLFSTQPFSDSIDQKELLCGDAKGDTLRYRENCTVITVRSNEWMAEHVMPYLYYFKNLKWFTYGYCWISDNICLPEGADQYGINPHSRYVHDPYDPLYDKVN